MRELFSVDARENYVQDLFGTEPSSLFLQARTQSDELKKTGISLSSQEGRILSLLLALHGSQRFVELGTLTGYSALWILHGMGTGRLWTFEKDEKHAAIAQRILQQWSGVGCGTVMVGDALHELKKIENEGPFDGIFIDANKAAYPDYLDWSEKHVRRGGLIIADNIFLRGAVWDEPTSEIFSAKQAQAMKDFNRRLADREKYQSVILPTSEGLFVALKRT